MRKLEALLALEEIPALLTVLSAMPLPWLIVSEAAAPGGAGVYRGTAVQLCRPVGRLEVACYPAQLPDVLAAVRGAGGEIALMAAVEGM